MDFSGKSIKAIYKASNFQGKQTSLNALNVTYLSKCFLFLQSWPSCPLFIFPQNCCLQ